MSDAQSLDGGGHPPQAPSAYPPGRQERRPRSRATTVVLQALVWLGCVLYILPAAIAVSAAVTVDVPRHEWGHVVVEVVFALGAPLVAWLAARGAARWTHDSLQSWAVLASVLVVCFILFVIFFAATTQITPIPPYAD